MKKNIRAKNCTLCLFACTCITVKYYVLCLVQEMRAFNALKCNKMQPNLANKDNQLQFLSLFRQTQSWKHLVCDMMDDAKET